MSARSHWVVADIEYEEIGGLKRKVPRRVDALCEPTSMPYNSTWVENNSGTKTGLLMTFDLDFSRSGPKWQKDGKLDWQAILSQLKKDHPVVYSFVQNVCISTGGKGLALCLAYSPMELAAEHSAKAEWLFRWVQRALWELFDYYGFGPDRGANGPVRWTMNWRNGDYRVYQNKELTKELWNKSNRSKLPVLSKLYDYLKSVPEVVSGKRRRWEDERFKLDHLWPDVRINEKMAHLIVDIFDEDYQLTLTAKELQKNYDFKPEFLYERLRGRTFPRLGLVVDNSEHGQWCFHLEPLSDSISLAFEIVGKSTGVSDKRGPGARGLSSETVLPEQIDDNERYAKIGMLILEQKWAGISAEECRANMDKLIPRIPGHEDSRNCRSCEITSKVVSIYRNKPEMLGIKSHLGTPEFLVPCLEPLLAKGFKQITEKSLKVQAIPVPSTGDCLNSNLGSQEEVEFTEPIGCLPAEDQDKFIFEQGEPLGEGEPPPVDSEGFGQEEELTDEAEPAGGDQNGALSAEDQTCVDLVQALFPKSAERLRDRLENKGSESAPEASSSTLEYEALPEFSEPSGGCEGLPESRLNGLSNKPPPPKKKLSEERRDNIYGEGFEFRMFAAFSRALTKNSAAEIRAAIELAELSARRGRKIKFKPKHPMRRVVTRWLRFSEAYRARRIGPLLRVLGDRSLRGDELKQAIIEALFGD